MGCDQTREFLEEYVLGTLEPSTRAEVEHHLSGCADCQNAAADLEAVAHRLTDALASASALQPPPALRDRVFAAVDAPETATARRPSSRWRRGVAIALAAALPALALGWAAGFQHASARESSRRNELARMLGVEEIVLEVVDSRETIKAFLRSTRETGPFGRSYGKLYTRRDLPDVVAFAARLPEPPDDLAYHLWLTTGGGRNELAGVLTIREGFGLVVFKARRPGPRYDAAFLTLQEKNGRFPRGTRVLAWRA
jgi:Putative zinc-finger